jgi:predicted thioesterase
MMERTASMLVYPLLPDGQATVGFEVCVKHVAAAPEGSSCSVQARLEEIVDGRKLRFTVEVSNEEGRTIGVGTHERRIIEVHGRADAPGRRAD